MKPTVLSVTGQDLTETFQTRLPGLPVWRPVVEVSIIPAAPDAPLGPVVNVQLVPKIDGAK